MASSAKDIDRERYNEKTLDVWQLRFARKLTSEETREIAENVTGVFRLLREWAVADAQRENPEDNRENRSTILDQSETAVGPPGKPRDTRADGELAERGV